MAVKEEHQSGQSTPSADGSVDAELLATARLLDGESDAGGNENGDQEDSDGVKDEGTNGVKMEESNGVKHEQSNGVKHEDQGDTKVGANGSGTGGRGRKVMTEEEKQEAQRRRQQQAEEEEDSEVSTSKDSKSDRKQEAFVHSYVAASCPRRSTKNVQQSSNSCFSDLASTPRSWRRRWRRSVKLGLMLRRRRPRKVRKKMLTGARRSRTTSLLLLVDRLERAKPETKLHRLHRTTVDVASAGNRLQQSARRKTERLLCRTTSHQKISRQATAAAVAPLLPKSTRVTMVTPLPLPPDSLDNPHWSQELRCATIS